MRSVWGLRVRVPGLRYFGQCGPSGIGAWGPSDFGVHGLGFGGVV